MEDQRAEEAWFENEWRSGRDPSRYGGCPMNLKPPVYPFQPYPFLFGCFISRQAEHKTDCYFYSEEHQMGATIPNCSYHNGGLGDCPCKDCEKYISKSDAHKIIMEKIKEH